MKTQHMPLWYIDYFELMTIETTKHKKKLAQLHVLIAVILAT
jgi:hypothetical protein